MGNRYQHTLSTQKLGRCPWPAWGLALCCQILPAPQAAPAGTWDKSHLVVEDMPGRSLCPRESSTLNGINGERQSLACGSTVTSERCWPGMEQPLLMPQPGTSKTYRVSVILISASWEGMPVQLFQGALFLTGDPSPKLNRALLRGNVGPRASSIPRVPL